MWNSDDVRDKKYTDQSTQTYIQTDLDFSDLDESNTAFYSAKSYVILGIDAEVQYDLDELATVCGEYPTKCDKFGNNCALVSKDVVDVEIQCELNGTSYASFKNDEKCTNNNLALSKPGVDKQIQCNLNESNEKGGDNNLPPGKTGIDKQIQCNLNEGCDNNTITVNKTEIDKQTQEIQNEPITVCSDNETCFSLIEQEQKLNRRQSEPTRSAAEEKPRKECKQEYCKSLKSDIERLFNKTGIDKQTQCDLNELNAGSNSHKSPSNDQKIQNEPITVCSDIETCFSFKKQERRLNRRQSEPTRSAAEEKPRQECEQEYCKQTQCDLNELNAGSNDHKSLSVDQKQEQRLNRRQSEPAKSPAEEKPRKECKNEYCKYQKIIPAVSSNENVETKDIKKVECKCVKPKVSVHKSNSQVAESADLCQPSFWSNPYFRMYFGPSLDETCFHTIDSLPLFQQCVRKLLSKTCGGNRNDEEGNNSSEGN